jgi:hypothetical protein
MVDFFSRAGLVHHAYVFISMMPFVLNKMDSVCSYKEGAGVLLSCDQYMSSATWVMSDCEFSADLKFFAVTISSPTPFPSSWNVDMFATVLCTLEGADPPTIVYTINGLGASHILNGGECQHHHRRGSSRLGRRGKDKLRQEEEKTEPHPCRMRRANVGMVGPE